MKTVAIVQARMGSTRLSRKVLRDIGGETMLARVVRRAQRAGFLDEVVIATTTLREDDVLVTEGARLGVRVTRGSPDDVLDRYYQAAQTLSAARIVRITSDCPLIDPEVIDAVGAGFVRSDCDYASNTLERSFPRGLDTEVFSIEALTRAWQQAREPFQREHVTPYLYQNPHLFQTVGIRAEQDYSAHRWTVDTPEDLELVRAIYARLGNTDTFTWREALAVVEREPALAALNQYIVQKALPSP